MKLSNRTLDLMKTIEEKTEELSKLYKELSNSVVEDTDGVLVPANHADYCKYFHLVNLSSDTPAEKMDVVVALSDLGSIKTTYDDNQQTHYKYNIEGHECLTIIEKE